MWRAPHRADFSTFGAREVLFWSTLLLDTPVFGTPVFGDSGPWSSPIFGTALLRHPGVISCTMSFCPTRTRSLDSYASIGVRAPACLLLLVCRFSPIAPCSSHPRYFAPTILRRTYRLPSSRAEPVSPLPATPIRSLGAPERLGRRSRSPERHAHGSTIHS